MKRVLSDVLYSCQVSSLLNACWFLPSDIINTNFCSFVIKSINLPNKYRQSPFKTIWHAGPFSCINCCLELINQTFFFPFFSQTQDNEWATALSETVPQTEEQKAGLFNYTSWRPFLMPAHNGQWLAEGVSLLVEDARCCVSIVFGWQISARQDQALHEKHKSSPWAVWPPAKFHTHQLRKSIWITEINSVFWQETE